MNAFGGTCTNGVARLTVTAPGDAVTVTSPAGINCGGTCTSFYEPITSITLTAHLEANGVGARPFWVGLSGQQPYSSYPRRLSGVSERLSGALVSLPCGSTLTVEQRDHVIAALASWHGEAIRS